MDDFLLEEDEHYQTQCGEMFFTTKGRLIFHCTLCYDKKFDGYDFFELHIKEHIPISFNDEQTEKDDISQYESVEITKNECQEIINENEVHPFTLVKEEIPTDEEDDVLREEEMPLSEIKKQKRLRLQTRRKVIRTTRKIKTNSANLNSKQQPRNLEGIVNIAKERSNENLQIPTVVREVQTRYPPRSALTPAEERKHKCPVCEVAFKDKHNMIHHLKRHSDNKDHKCPECDKRFYTTSEVRVHRRSHTNERPFLCSLCGRSFITNTHLMDHMKRHLNQRDHKCEICGKAFYDGKLLKDHMICHSSDRPFPCNICPAKFRRRNALKYHIMLHENKREFKCELCDSGFIQRGGLISHMKKAHKTE